MRDQNSILDEEGAPPPSFRCGTCGSEHHSTAEHPKPDSEVPTHPPDESWLSTESFPEAEPIAQRSRPLGSSARLPGGYKSSAGAR
jgi:hypothetical protein